MRGQYIERLGRDFKQLYLGEHIERSRENDAYYIQRFRSRAPRAIPDVVTLVPSQSATDNTHLVTAPTGSCQGGWGQWE